MHTTAAHAKGEVGRGITWLARSGYAARGVVYIIVGAFAFMAGIGSGETVGTKGAIQQLLSQPFGTVLLWIMVVGLLAYAAWRITQAITDPEGHGTEAKGLVIRAGLVGGAITYSLLALFTLGLLGTSIGESSGGGNGGSGGGGDFLSGLLGWKYSNYLVYAVALIPLGVGIAHIIKGWKAKFEKYFYASEDVMRWVRPISRAGLIARGIAFLIVAGMLFSGGTRYEPTDPPGLEDALNALQSLPFGAFWLSIVGLGLVAFALYSISEAIWRRIDTAAVMG